MQNKLQKLTQFVVVLTFFIPLLFLPKHFIFPFIVPKIVLFRSLVLVMLGLYILLLIIDWQKWRPRLTSINIVVFLFWLSFAISTFSGVDWYRSFWDGHERMLGLFTVTHYIIYYFIVTALVREWKDWQWLLQVFLVAGGVVMFIALLQRFNHEFLYNRSVDRSASTLGNPIYVGGYGLFLVMIAWLSYIKGRRVLWKWVSLACGFLGALGVFFSGSRGALLGLFSGIAVLSLGYLLTMKNNKQIRKIFYGVIGIFVLAGAVVFPLRQTHFVKNIPALGRLLNTGLDTAGTRLIAWEIAVEAWQERPFLGWGPTNYYYAFNKLYRAEILRYGYAETWFDNAHNIVLNTLAERGVVGVIIFLAMFIVPVILLWRMYLSKKDDESVHLVLVSTAFLFAHLVQTVSVFENPTSYLYFFFFLAMINSGLYFGGSSQNNDLKDNTSLPTVVFGLTFILVLLMVYTTNINPARANMVAAQFIRELHQLKDVRPTYEKVISIPSPHIDDIRNDLSKTLTDTIRGYVQQGKGALSKSLFELSMAETDKNRKLHPLDVRVHGTQALLLQSVYSFTEDKVFLEQAEKITEDALLLSPERQQFLFTLAGIKVQLGKPNEAEALYRQNIENYPKIAESWWRLALLLDVVFKKTDEAVALLDKGVAEYGFDDFGNEGNVVVKGIRDKFKLSGIAVE